MTGLIRRLLEDACVRRLLQSLHSATLEKSQAGHPVLEYVVDSSFGLRSGSISVQWSLDWQSLIFSCKNNVILGTDKTFTEKSEREFNGLQFQRFTFLSVTLGKSATPVQPGVLLHSPLPTLPQ